MIVRQHQAAGMRSVVTYSDCGGYRYDLRREWGAGPRVSFVMLNPSTADELRNDPTVARCERRARVLGFQGLRVVNLFGWRATDPRDMRAQADPVGPGNDDAIMQAAAWADQVICAWGVHGAHLGRGAQVAAMLRGRGHRLVHLGLTRDGHPRHPLYVAYEQQPVLWR